MLSPVHLAFSFICAATTPLIGLAFYYVFLVPRFNPLQRLAGPPVRTLFGNHLSFILK